MFNVKKLIVTVLLSAYCLVPSAIWAANVGFVPSTGLWFSRTEFSPGETIRVYTVIINNDYHSLDGAVAFYDNGQVIDTVAVQGLTKESAKQIRVFWEPAEGQHAVTARFTKAVAVDAQGKKQEVDIGTINSVAGAPLAVGGEKLYSVQQTPTAPSDSTGAASTTPVAIGEVQLVVKKQGEKLVIAPAPVVKVGTQSPPGEAGAAEDLLSKNREALAKAEQLAGTITTTAGKINSAYDKTKSAVEEGKGYYEKGRERWGKTVPYIKRAEPFWNTISNNNEPKRVAIIVGSIIVLWLVMKWMFRRRRKRRLREEFEE